MLQVIRQKKKEKILFKESDFLKAFKNRSIGVEGNEHTYVCFHLDKIPKNKLLGFH